MKSILTGREKISGKRFGCHDVDGASERRRILELF